MSHHHDVHEIEDHDRGLDFDLKTLADRRMVLGLIGGASVAALAACSSGGSGTSGDATATASPSASASSPASGDDVGEIPEETAGPYPGDGSNGPNVLTEDGIVRGDIRPSFGSATGTAEGVETTVTLTVIDADSDEPMPGAAVYLWHCDRDGNYSLYSEGVTDQNYLRGVQEADSAGVITFTTIFPACYSGRWPHMHFEVYESLATALAAGEKLKTSQLALPQDVCEDVYDNADGYSRSVQNLSQVSLDSDNVFSDGYELQVATVTGSVDEGFEVTLNVGV